MASFLEAEYYASVKPRLDSAIDSALEFMAGELRNSLIESASERVYAAHTPPLYFLRKRRGELLKDSSYVTKSGSGAHSIEIENIAVTQCGAGGEVNWVESGYRQHNAGARPFMEKGLSEYVQSSAESDLMSALAMSGF